jgi:hypothetical protein
MIGRTLLSLAALALAGLVALALIGLWDRHSPETATTDSSGTYERGFLKKTSSLRRRMKP